MTHDLPAIPPELAQDIARLTVENDGLQRLVEIDSDPETLADGTPIAAAAVYVELLQQNRALRRAVGGALALGSRLSSPFDPRNLQTVRRAPAPRPTGSSGPRGVAEPGGLASPKHPRRAGAFAGQPEGLGAGPHEVLPLEVPPIAGLEYAAPEVRSAKALELLREIGARSPEATEKALRGGSHLAPATVRGLLYLFEQWSLIEEQDDRWTLTPKGWRALGQFTPVSSTTPDPRVEVASDGPGPSRSLTHEELDLLMSIRAALRTEPLTLGEVAERFFDTADREQAAESMLLMESFGWAVSHSGRWHANVKPAAVAKLLNVGLMSFCDLMEELCVPWQTLRPVLGSVPNASVVGRLSEGLPEDEPLALSEVWSTSDQGTRAIDEHLVVARGALQRALGQPRSAVGLKAQMAPFHGFWRYALRLMVADGEVNEQGGKWRLARTVESPAREPDQVESPVEVPRPDGAELAGTRAGTVEAIGEAPLVQALSLIRSGPRSSADLAREMALPQGFVELVCERLAIAAYVRLSYDPELGALWTPMIVKAAS